MLEEPFKKLEEKVRKTAEAVRSLRKENQSLKKALTEAGSSRSRRSGGDKKELMQLRKHQAGLEKELNALQREKSTVRTRVQGLLKQLDKLDLD